MKYDILGQINKVLKSSYLSVLCNETCEWGNEARRTHKVLIGTKLPLQIVPYSDTGWPNKVGISIIILVTMRVFGKYEVGTFVGQK